MIGQPPDPSAAADQWFRRRTWHVDAVDVDDLVRRKRAQGVTVTVVLPARNEAATIAGVVESCAALGGTLVDELVVFDGDSDDGTAELAAAAGARVHRDREVLGAFGPPRGKGDALWRSLSVTSGDVVCFVDTDIRNPSPRFVTGLLAPLLGDPEVSLVKAFYERPLEVANEQQVSGGGRVTELCARPLLNLFWPPLAGLVQPLSGEYAGRRELLEAIPFFTGYGVELGMLVDTLARAGVDAIAQVDVHERIHRNQPLEALGRMSFGILQVAARRLADEGRAGALGDLPTTLMQFSRTDAGTLPEPHDVAVEERPPLRTLR